MAKVIPPLAFQTRFHNRPNEWSKPTSPHYTYLRLIGYGVRLEINDLLAVVGERMFVGRRKIVVRRFWNPPQQQ